MVYMKCADMTKSILEGNININPYKKSDGKIPCTYCQYASICQFDSSLGNSYRAIGRNPSGFEKAQGQLTAAEEGGAR